MVFHDVLLQLAGALERGSTLGAERPLRRVVLFLVPLLAGRVREPSFADGALEAPLAIMRLPVAAQIRPLQESSLAEVAREAALVRLVVGGQMFF